MIQNVNGERRYFDKNGNEIKEGSFIRYPDGRQEIVYRTTEGELGVDATNRSWIERGWAVPCEHGIYPLTAAETERVELADDRITNALLGPKKVAQSPSLDDVIRDCASEVRSTNAGGRDVADLSL